MSALSGKVIIIIIACISIIVISSIVIPIVVVYSNRETTTTTTPKTTSEDNNLYPSKLHQRNSWYSRASLYTASLSMDFAECRYMVFDWFQKISMCTDCIV